MLVCERLATCLQNEVISQVLHKPLMVLVLISLTSALQTKMRNYETHYCSCYVIYVYIVLKYIYIYIILIARVRVQYGKIFYEHAKYFHEPKASENVA